MIKGIDISTWQKRLDYNALKAKGIDFAIIRCGYGKEISQKDNMFETHYVGCKNADIKVGAYLYSYATSIDSGTAEGRNCLEFIKGKTFDLPIYIDLEEQSTASLGRSACTQIAKNFCNVIKSAGLRAGVYANLNWLNNYINTQELIDDNISIWLAQWSSSMSNRYRVDIWQNTNNLEGMNIDGDLLVNESLINNTTPVIDKDKTIEQLAKEVIER